MLERASTHFTVSRPAMRGIFCLVSDLSKHQGPGDIVYAASSGFEQSLEATCHYISMRLGLAETPSQWPQ